MRDWPIAGHRARLPACAQFLQSPHSRVFLKTCLFESLQHAIDVHRSRVDFDATRQFGVDMQPPCFEERPDLLAITRGKYSSDAYPKRMPPFDLPSLMRMPGLRWSNVCRKTFDVVDRSAITAAGR